MVVETGVRRGGGSKRKIDELAASGGFFLVGVAGGRSCTPWCVCSVCGRMQQLIFAGRSRFSRNFRDRVTREPGVFSQAAVHVREKTSAENGR